MIREIKFRGKLLNNGEWVYGHLFIWSNGRCDIENEDNRGFKTVYSVDPATVGQYAGLEDKNEREVYEDEILTDCYGSIGVVEWENGRFVVNFGAGDVFEIGECFNEPCEVWSIGNIHDNPELLNQ